MRISVLYDQGSAAFPEDGIIFQPPFFLGVTDGVSGIYLPKKGSRLFEGRSGGQFASHVIAMACGMASEEEPLEKILQRANAILRKQIARSGLSLQESELIPSATFAVAKVTEESINIIQGGDSLAVWSMKDGTIGGIPNRLFIYEADLLSIVTMLMEKHKGNRQKMWEEYLPILAEKRRASINTIQGGFAVMNGQPEVERFWQKFVLPREEVRLLILFSDGFVPFKWTRDEILLAEKVLNLYQRGGIQLILDESRAIAELEKDSSHEDQPEATVIAIEF